MCLAGDWQHPTRSTYTLSEDPARGPTLYGLYPRTRVLWVDSSFTRQRLILVN